MKNQFVCMLLAIISALTLCAHADGTVYYVNPDGGKYYHAKRECVTVREEYRAGMIEVTEEQLGQPPHDQLTVCNLCFGEKAPNLLPDGTMRFNILPSGVGAADIAVCRFPLPDGYEVFDAAWIGGAQDQALLLLGSRAEDAVRLAVGVRREGEDSEIVAMSRSLFPFDELEPVNCWMLDKWNDGRPYFWWGGGTPKKEQEIYLRLHCDERGEWVVSGGHVADGMGNVRYGFWQEEAGLLTVRGETPYPEIDWRTDVSMQLDGFDLAAVEDVCREAMACVEGLRAYPDCVGYSVWE